MPSDTFTSEALVYWKFVIYILTVICVYAVTRLLGVNPLLASAFTCFAIFTGRSYFDIRPAGFSNLLTAVFLLILVLAAYKNILYIWLIVPLTVVWANLHGGYIYVFIMIAVFLGLHIFNRLPKIWSFVLYNLLAWPACIFVYATTDWGNLLPDEANPVKGSLVYLFFVVVIIGVFLTFFKDKLITIERKGLYHTLAASLAAFIAMILLNPFHLANLTHTFVISISKHAQKWRTVNEWHPAFEWSNPVGTAYPFLIMFIMGIAILLFWFFSRRLIPKLLSAPKDRLAVQSRSFNFFLKIFAFSAAILVFWVVLLSFAFINYDPFSFIICTAFAAVLLLSIYQHAAFIFLSIPIVLFGLSASVVFGSQAFDGRYIYPFIMIPAYCIMCIVASLLSKKVLLKKINIAIVAATAVVLLFLVSIIYNPFNLPVPSWPLISSTGLFPGFGQFLHCLYERIAAVFANLLNLKVSWYPAYIHNAEPSYSRLFISLYIINVISIVAFVLFCYRLYFYRQQPASPVSETKQNQYKPPKIDIVLWAIAALTVYMATRSRRFIPIAAIAICPVLALFLQQIVCSISASINFYRKNRLSIPPMSEALQKFFLIVAAALTAYLGTTWTLKFKSVYLDPWPTDYKFTSVFMRMTASEAKPFEAVKFIKDNKLSGNMFNYWTEGGFIAWGQDPDPNTGKTPLQLFVDGRAQAAYEPQAYDAWSYLMGGGLECWDAARQKRPVNYKKAGLEIADALRKYNVWVILMPAEEFDSDFYKAIEANPDWLLIYFDRKQRLLIDKKNPRTKDLFTGVFDGTTVYPDDFSKNLVLSYYKLNSENPSDLKEGLDYAIRAYYCEPSHLPVERAVIAAKYELLRPRIDKFCRDVFDDFEKNKEQYKKQNGFHDRMVAALIAAQYLQRNAELQKNLELAATYADKVRQYDLERRLLVEPKRW